MQEIGLKSSAIGAIVCSRLNLNAITPSDFNL